MTFKIYDVSEQQQDRSVISLNHTDYLDHSSMIRIISEYCLCLQKLSMK